ncbi:hypothetical protein [Azospirillum halopraeferens]|uniref:hypothetical protein n=1 Tax=Azospirillum halopraeferens TaxID=34010 RepID=UPI0012EBF2B0|nr:hypothetical protein [Azospirillum halopraeferens]
MSAIDPGDTVLVLGTGLTMVDTVLTLLDRGNRGPIIAVLRRGLLPHRHEETRPCESFVRPEVMPHTVLDVLIAFKADVHRAAEQGQDRRSAFDALRPHHHRIRASLSEAERRRFLRHARPFRDVHRHRMAPKVAGRIEAARRDGHLSVHAGRLRSLTLTDGGIRATIDGRDGEPVADMAQVVSGGPVLTRRPPAPRRGRRRRCSRRSGPPDGRRPGGRRPPR